MLARAVADHSPSLSRAGRTLAFTRVEMTSAKTGKLLAFGSHTKAIGATLEHAENKKFTEDGEKEIPLKGQVQ